MSLRLPNAAPPYSKESEVLMTVAHNTRRFSDGSDQLTRLLEPRSIAIIGASADPAKRGYQVIRSLVEAGFDGQIFPVNPRGGELLGLAILPNIEHLPNDVDVALVSIPGRAVPQVLRELAAKGVGGAVVLANEFLEASHDGVQLDAELKAAIAETGIRVIGPNTSGIFNVALGANLVGLTGVAEGPISVVTQSGNMLLSLVADNAALRGPGFQFYIGLGNQADVQYDECVSFLAHDDSTGAIAIHAEGLQDGRAFLIAAAGAAAKRPVVMLRGGRSEVGQRTALSHTGSIAGSDAVASAVLAQAGVELVDRSDELAIVAGALATTAAIPEGRKVAILSDGGGHATLAADALSVAGIELATLSSQTQARLRELLGPPAEVKNPVDVAGATDTQPGLFADCVEVVMADNDVGMVLVVGMYGGYHLRFDRRLEPQEDATARRMLDASSRYGMPLLVQSCYAAGEVPNHDILRSGGVQVLASIDHAVRVVAALSHRGKWLSTVGRRSSLRLPEPLPVANDRPDGALDEPAARRLVERSGFSTGDWVLACSAEQVVTATEKFGRPCAVKVVSPEVVHKSDVGGVRLDITPETANAAWEDIIGSVTAAVPGAAITGVVVAPMADRGVELLIGATRDPIFGPIVAFGSGGLLVEALRDITFRAAPFTLTEATEMIEETIASRILDGYRGLPNVDRSELAAFLVRVGDLITTHPRIAELDLNPVIANESSILPVDVRIILSDPK